MLVPPLKAAKLLERDVTRQIRDYLKARGWRPIRMQRTVMPGQFQTGEPGMADYLFVFYLKRPAPRGAALSLWIEMKGQTDKRRCNCATRMMRGKKGKCTPCTQRDWRASEETRGALFAPGHDFDAFESFYLAEFSWLHDGRLPGQINLFGGAA